MERMLEVPEENMDRFHTAPEPEFQEECVSGEENPLRQAFKDAIPLMAGLIPFGLTYGILARQAGLSWLETYAMSLLVFAGAAQFTAVGMFGAGVINPAVLVFTTLLINARHFLMAASLSSHLKNLPIRWRALLAFGMVDESYALTVAKFSKGTHNHKYMLGANLAIYIAWTTTSGIGGMLGGLIDDPLKWGLDFAMPATFIVLLIPQLATMRDLLVCLITGVASLACISYLPGSWHILIACITAIIFTGVVDKLCAQNSL